MNGTHNVTSMVDERRTHRSSVIPPLVLTAVFLLAFALLARGIVTGSISMFLNPRIVPRTVITLAALVLLGAAETFLRLRRRGGAVRARSRESTRSTHDEHRDHDEHSHGSGLRRVLPLIVTIALIPAAARHASADYSDIRLFVPAGAAVTSSGGSSPAPSGALPSPSRDSESGGWVGPANEDLLAAVAEVTAGPDTESTELGAGPITIDSDNFDRIIQALWDDPVAYRGRTVRMTGFVYRRPEWQTDQFVAARMLIWCCVADAIVTGLLVQPTTSNSAPRDRQWIEIEGTLDVTERFSAGSLEMASVPTLTDTVWLQVSPPDQEYVFSATATLW